ncbi:hypothetical protein NPIL_241711 [Nephila pilipes]|uniref:Uncharacterized protein n=1 Tax=Nephila pilipes TaxID=299642 RepID=A0A8X6MEU6_NEPPI|nr:hypothetical protein NPIL_241711 [Nephila pilipes]
MRAINHRCNFQLPKAGITHEIKTKKNLSPVKVLCIRYLLLSWELNVDPSHKSNNARFKSFSPYFNTDSFLSFIVPTSLESRGCSRWHLEQNEALKQISGSLFHPYSSGDSSLVANRCVPVLPLPTP